MTKLFSIPKKEENILSVSQILEKEKMREERDNLGKLFERKEKWDIHLSNDFKEIIEFLGDDLPRPDSYHFIVKIFNQPEINAHGLINPDGEREKERHISMVGLILAMGPDCYNSEKFKKWNKRSVGDWVLFAPGEGTLFQCKGVSLRFIGDDRVFCKTNNPELITRT